MVACDHDIASSQVPSVVKNTFKNEFPQAKNLEWDSLKYNYEVSFEMKQIDHVALLNSSGNLLKYKYEIDQNMLPTSIISFLEQEHSREKWEDSEHIIDGNSDYFQLKLDGFLKDKKLVVDSMGKVLPNIKYWN